VKKLFDVSYIRR